MNPLCRPDGVFNPKHLHAGSDTIKCLGERILLSRSLLKQPYGNGMSSRLSVIKLANALASLDCQRHDSPGFRDFFVSQNLLQARMRERCAQNNDGRPHGLERPHQTCNQLKRVRIIGVDFIKNDDFSTQACEPDLLELCGKDGQQRLIDGSYTKGSKQCQS